MKLYKAQSQAMKSQGVLPWFDWGVVARCYTMLISGLYSFSALTQPETLVYQVAHADRFAQFVVLVLCVLTIFGTLDTVINDLLPERFIIRRALHDRHLVSMAIAGCFAVQMWTCARYDLPDSVLYFFGIQVLLIPIAAFSDVHKRYRDKR